MILFVQERCRMEWKIECCWRITQNDQSISQYINQPINQLKESNEKVGHLFRNRIIYKQDYLWYG